jgi:hypothetical protein
MHGSAAKGASNAEPQMGTASDLASMEKLDLPAEVSARRKTSDTFLLLSLQVFSHYLVVVYFVFILDQLVY